jgi:hypothetical protein
MRRLTAVPVLLLALAACSDDEPAATPSPSSTPSPSASPTANPAPSPSATTAPSPTRGPAAEGDVDGDGREDEIGATATTLTVRLTGGGTVTSPVSSDSPRAPKLLGSHDVDRDGHAEVFLLTASGASTQFASVYRYDGTALHELRLGDEAARLGIGGTATHGDGFRCRPDGLLELRSASSDDGTTYRVTSTTYRLATTELRRVRSATATAKQGDPAVEGAYTVDCGGVSDGS